MNKIALQDFSNILGQLKGVSDKQLQAHFKLYEGYVNKYNEIREKLSTQDKTAANYSFGAFSELKRREAVAYNGALLHQLYFENLSGQGGEPSEEIKHAVTQSFGNWSVFVQDIKSSAISTPGWVIVTVDPQDKQVHTWIMYEHHIGYPANHTVILALDCWEHAFMIDYGTNKAEYLRAFLENIDWEVVNKRYKACM